MSLASTADGNGNGNGMRAKPPRSVVRAIPALVPRDPANLDRAHSSSNGKEVPTPFEMAPVVVPTFPNRKFDVRDFGAIGDSLHDCSEGIAKAIAACAQAGGGRVLIPE